MNDSNAFATLGKVHNRSGADVAAVLFLVLVSLSPNHKNIGLRISYHPLHNYIERV